MSSAQRLLTLWEADTLLSLERRTDSEDDAGDQGPVGMWRWAGVREKDSQYAALPSLKEVVKKADVICRSEETPQVGLS